MADVGLTCKSVLGGWQTFITHTDVPVGPCFRTTGELWEWQREHIVIPTQTAWLEEDRARLSEAIETLDRLIPENIC